MTIKESPASQPAIENKAREAGKLAFVKQDEVCNMQAADGIGDALRVSYYQSTSTALIWPERI
jgi:hypothetical protein